MKRYDLFIEPQVHQERQKLPGHVRQRIKQIIFSLATEQRPSSSIPINVTGLNVPQEVELRRIKVAEWRILYAICDAEAWVWVWGIRKRPPYDYEDLSEMVAKIPF